MNQIQVRIIFILAAYILFFVDLLTIPFRRKTVTKDTGNKVMDLTGSSIIQKIVIYILAFGLISTIWIRDFGPMMNFVLCGCGVFAAELMTKDVALYKLYGVYEKGIIFDGSYFAFDSMIGFPVLQLSQEEQKNYDSKTLYFVTKNKGSTSFTFATEEEYKAVVEQMFKLKPELQEYIK